MADIKPFKAYRPIKDKVGRVSALPYDVFSRKEAYEEVKRNPDSFLAIDRPETQFAEDYDMYAPEVYQKAHDMLWGQIESGVFEQDETKEEDRIKHVYTCEAQTGPIFLCYRNNKMLSDLVAKIKEVDEPVYDFTSDDGVKNRVWIISDLEETETICRIFATIDSIYIADGHHRCASAVKVGLRKREENAGKARGKQQYDYFLSVLFPDNELMIMDYNRVVKDLNGLTKEAFIDKLEDKFDIERSNEAVKPSCKGEFGLYLEDEWYKLVAKEHIRKSDAVEGLDVSVLQNEVLSPILGIGDPRTDKRIDFVGGIRGLKELEDRCHKDMKLAFSMYPTSISELFDVADAERLMPPKSTWFEPKLLSGLFIHSI